MMNGDAARQEAKQERDLAERTVLLGKVGQAGAGLAGELVTVGDGAEGEAGLGGLLAGAAEKRK